MAETAKRSACLSDPGELNAQDAIYFDAAKNRYGWPQPHRNIAWRNTKAGWPASPGWRRARRSPQVAKATKSTATMTMVVSSAVLLRIARMCHC